jgi:hypothetical protein
MRIADLLLPELDLEAGFTRAHLERVPMDRLDYKPHDRSMLLGWLATFTAILPSWGEMMITKEFVDLVAEGKNPDYQIAQSQQALLAKFDKAIAGARTALAGASDAHLQTPWAVKAGDAVIFSRPRHLVFRTYFVNHMIHPRAQLGVYLRLLGVAVPAVYSDSADERGGMFVDG